MNVKGIEACWVPITKELYDHQLELEEKTH